MNAFETPRGPLREGGADRQDEENGRRERNCEGSQHRLLHLIGLAQAAAEQENAAVRTLTGDEQRRRAPVQIGRKPLADEVGASVDGNGRHSGTFPNAMAPFSLNKAT